ncbi:MAG: type II secretion system F family protein [Acidimicrobiia bacterium]|nr:type II secretion system F family protein [Acidimicrobiia bacterium]MDH5503337.1 type II secretion system F family protein [Acidimicrobiia bacterium]
MTVVVAVVGVLGWEPVLDRLGRRSSVGVATALALATLSLRLLVLLVGVSLIVRLVRQVSQRRRVDRQADRDVAVLARGMYVAVSAGLSVTAALSVATIGLSTAIDDEVRTLIRAARRDGMALALAEAPGRCGKLFGLLARAQGTGASVADAIAGYVDEQRESHRLEVTEAARRLPIKLTVPLALLILPGFVVLTVGPSVLESARRLLGPVFPIP